MSFKSTIIPNLCYIVELRKIRVIVYTLCFLILLEMNIMFASKSAPEKCDCTLGYLSGLNEIIYADSYTLVRICDILITE